MKKYWWKKIAAGAMAFVLAGGLLCVNVTSRAAMITEENEEIVSFRTVDRDIMIATTENAKYTSSEIADKMTMDTSTAKQSHRINVTDIDASDISNWYVYDHYDTKAYGDQVTWQLATGYNPNLRPYYAYSESSANVLSTTPKTVDEALRSMDPVSKKNVFYMKEHIAASSDNGNAAMKFYGYGMNPYTDFLFYPADQTGTKKVEYTIDAKDVKPHSLYQAGFLFNCGIQANKISGYAMMFSFLAPEGVTALTGDIKAAGLKAVTLYKIQNLDIELLHNTKTADVYETNGSTTVIKSILDKNATILKSVDLSNLDFDGHFDVSNVEMRITNTTLKVFLTEAGAAVEGEPQTKTLFDIQSDDRSNRTTYLSTYTSTGHGGFGPVVQYQPHDCYFTSSYIYSNLKMSISESESVLSGLSNADYTVTKYENGEYVDNNRYFVLIGDNTQGEEGYKDCFKRDFDDVYLEMLKKQGVILITNLNIKNVNSNINGTNYNLEDYLGKGNVIQIKGNTQEELAANIQKEIERAEYSKKNADTAEDALNATGHDDHATARCIVTYQGKQVDKINISRIGEDYLKLKIDSSMSINVVGTPTYSIRKPNGDVLTVSGGETRVQNDGTWPTGEYVATVQYNNRVSASTTFYVTSAYNSYLNGQGLPEGTAEDHLYCLSGTLGVNRVTPGHKYETRLVADDTYRLPKHIVVKTDTLPTGTVTDENGVVRNPEDDTVVPLTTLTEGTDYTYDSETGDIVVSEQVITGNVYIYADTYHVTYQLTNMKAGTDAPQSVSSLDDSNFTATLQTNPSALPMPGYVYVSLGRNEYKITEGIPKRVDNGTVSYKGNTVTISKQLLHQDVKLRAATGEFQVYYTTNMDCLEKGGQNGPLSYKQDYEDILTAQSGYVIKSVEAALGEEKDAKGKPLHKIDSLQFDAGTGRLHIDGEDITNDVYISVVMGPKEYRVIPIVSHATMKGGNVCKTGQDYTSRFTADYGYELPAQVTVLIGGQTVSGQAVSSVSGQAVATVSGQAVVTGGGTGASVSGQTVSGQAVSSVSGQAVSTVSGQAVAADSYEYDKETGDFWIDGGVINGDLIIAGDAKKIEFTVAGKVKNGSFEGSGKCNMLEPYHAVLQAEEGYVLPEKITVTSKGKTLADKEYKYNRKTGAVDIPAAAIEGNVVISATAEKLLYGVTVDMENILFEGKTSCDTLEDYRAQLSVEEPYFLPDTIQIFVADRELEAEKYQYDKKTGEVILPKEQITGDILIKAEAGRPQEPKKEYSVTYRLVNLTATGKSRVTEGEHYVMTLAPKDGYGMPQTLYITSGGKELKIGEQYGYNGITGVVTIPAECIEGDIVISASGAELPKEQQQKPDVSKLTVIPPKYENSFDGKVIGVTNSMEYSTDGGEHWTRCKGGQITGLGTGTLFLRYAATSTKKSGQIAMIELDSATMEYYLPTISMSKQMGRNKKFQLKIRNLKGADVHVDSSDKSIVKVNKSGLITSKKKLGKAKVVVTIMKGKHVVQYVANIKVVKNVRKNYSLAKFKTTYKEPTIALYKKLTKGKKWNIKMTHTKNAVISFKSSNTKVATVSKSGVVKGKKSGNTRITITVLNEGVIDQYYVIVRVYKKGEKSDMSYLKEVK